MYSPILFYLTHLLPLLIPSLVSSLQLFLAGAVGLSFLLNAMEFSEMLIKTGPILNKPVTVITPNVGGI